MTSPYIKKVYCSGCGIFVEPNDCRLDDANRLIHSCGGLVRQKPREHGHRKKVEAT